MDLLLQQRHVYSLFAHHLEHCLQGPLVPDAHVILILVEDELLVFLIDCIISEMHTHILHVFLIGRHIGFCGESAQSLSEDEDPEWVHACHQHVDAQVELESIDEVGTAEVSLDHAVLLRVDVLQLPRQEDALALREALRLDDVGPGLALGLAFEVCSKVLVVAGQVPGEWEVVILFWSLLAHLHEVFGEEVLAGEGVHAWEVVDLLVVLHLHQHLGSYCPVGPPDVPFGVVAVGLHFPLQFLPHFGHDFVLAIWVGGGVPETLTTMRSKRTTLTQFGANLGTMVWGAVSSLLLSLSWFFLFMGLL